MGDAVCHPGMCERCDALRRDPRGSSSCGIYTLIRRVSDKRIFRLFTNDGAIKIPNGYEEFFTEDPDQYQTMKRM